MATDSWQLQVFKRSLKKKEKLRLLERNLDVTPNSLNLDLGCAQGTLSYFLRQKGGCWLSADMDFLNLQAAQTLLRRNLVQLKEGPLPFKDNSFDLVACLDYLEHLEQDDFCLEEIGRVLKKNGHLVLATPQTGRFFVLHKLRSFMGLKLEFYGHKREGYSIEAIQMKLRKAGFAVQSHESFSRFFTELLELMLNFFYIKFFPDKIPLGLRDGHIRPTTAEEFHNKKKTFRLYSFLYPAVWMISRIDKVLFPLKGYGLMVWAQRSVDS